MQYQVDSKWLKDHLVDRDIRIVDCSYKLGDPEAGRTQYDHGHIPGAVYFDLEKDLSGAVETHGGRHPLPKQDQLKRKLEESGISNDTILIAYDSKEGAYASRFWWLLKYVGHEKVYILNGGIEAWKNAGYPVDHEIPKYDKAVFVISLNKDLLASYEEVKDIVLNRDRDNVLIDSREQKRYLGIEEPIDRIAGHIPTAINKPWMEGLENGFFKPKTEQENRFADIAKDKPIIVYCGSGVTATPNYIALKEAGYSNVRLYAGSYSDWVSYEENPVEKGNAGS
ncbi:sulfurtransferase [Bacillus sp. JJ1609]|uniref:sulfurtransferase n=1 Tax=Bacillus sp. JJ1609 TaxID=3122977 RepID=UPI003000B264